MRHHTTTDFARRHRLFESQVENGRLHRLLDVFGARRGERGRDRLCAQASSRQARAHGPKLRRRRLYQVDSHVHFHFVPILFVFHALSIYTISIKLPRSLV